MREKPSLWVVIQVAHSQARAQAAGELLKEEGFMVQVRPVNKAVNTGDPCYEILALTSEAKEAREVLRDMGY